MLEFIFQILGVTDILNTAVEQVELLFNDFVLHIKEFDLLLQLVNMVKLNVHLRPRALALISRLLPLDLRVIYKTTELLVFILAFLNNQFLLVDSFLGVTQVFDIHLGGELQFLNCLHEAFNLLGLQLFVVGQLF